ncbi:hypothetical protein BX589_10192 [Paraburkholderia fungorum]|jgi:hypothetical protein|uniref:hypothetical protein n=1 Tax=Paraburkholderia fungorum TaxID=134537 RepID=UPI000D04FE84|nr:hypothetical protein [Paraburkholderia fungorum]PRZ56442.1 hypothetical protein BX589_10192 [Paraburkholderia fungorum]
MIHANAAIAHTPSSDGETLLVKLPFELKDAFKGVFKSAKWVPEQRSWRVGNSAVTRNKLAAFAAASEPTLGALADKIRAEEEAELDERQTEEMNRALRVIEAELQDLAIKTRAAKKECSTLGALRAKLDAYRPLLDAAKATLMAEKRARDDELLRVRERADALLKPFPELGDAISEARRGWRALKAGHYGAKAGLVQAQRELLRIYERIEEVSGVQFTALLAAFNCNTNRTDRDDLPGDLDRLYIDIKFPAAERVAKAEADAIASAIREGEEASLAETAAPAPQSAPALIPRPAPAPLRL